MRIAYLDCFAGIAGDMFLGALIDAGVPPSILQQAVVSLGIGATLTFETVDRSGISACKVHVQEHGQPAEPKLDAPLEPEQQQPAHTHSAQPQTQHLHKIGHAHDHANSAHDRLPHTHDHAEQGHAHPHAHGRSLSAIRQIIKTAALHDNVKATAIRAFELLGASEARIHNVPVEEIHFHEVGAVDAIADIVACSVGIHHLQIDTWYASAVNVGGGMVQCAHGNFPVPAPATADLLRGLPTYSAHIQKELVTPTGAALLRALNATFGQQPPMRVESIGYGAGTRNPEGFPNVLRLSVGQAGADSQLDTTHSAQAHHQHTQHAGETVTVLESALDDLSPQVLAYVAEKALASGALDVMLTPVVMKKGRPGTLLTILCNPSESVLLQQLLLRETSTLGVRIRHDSRVCLERSHTSVETPFGSIRIKIGSSEGQERNAAPEFEDCRAAAERSGAPLKQVQQAAIAAYRNRS